MKKLGFLIIFLCGWLFSSQAATMDSLEIKYLKQAQDSLFLKEIDFGFEKKMAKPEIPFQLKTVLNLMDRPLQLPVYMDSAKANLINRHQSLSRLIQWQIRELGFISDEQQIDKLERQLFQNIGDPRPQKNSDPFSLATKPEINHAVDRALVIIDNAFELSNVYLKKSFCSLDQNEKAYLNKFANSNTELEQNQLDSILTISRKIDFQSLFKAQLIIALAVEMAKKELVSINAEEECRSDFLYQKESSWGKVAVGGYGTNYYNDEYALIIDLGGDDEYRGKFAASLNQNHPFGIVIDLSGGDLYRSNQSVNAGAGIFGSGILWDCSGNDIYHQNSLSLGCGIFGMGVLIDEDGDDLYKGQDLSQGSAIFGLGILIDKNGDDTYRATSYNQGCGGPMAYGLLMDLGGNDNYYSGGVKKHAPLLPNDYQSFSQGFAFGWRSLCGGGIGILFDKEGNDFYNADVFAQGASYWYALGGLIDENGNDHYLATEYAQGAGIHCSVGYLLDEQGDDQYFSRFGPSQGSGHDYSVGVLIDKSGNDAYQVSGGQGVGLNNSVGIFIDSDGDDTYLTTEQNGQGDANISYKRNFGGIGIFLDLNGNDYYPSKRSADNNKIWRQGSIGIGLDVNARQTTESTTIMEKSPLALESSVEEIFKEASLWEVGSAKIRVRVARCELIKRGEEALEYIIAQKMKTNQGLELRTIKELIDSLPLITKPKFIALINHPNDTISTNAIYLLGETKTKEAVTPLLKALKKDKHSGTILWSLGEINDSRAVPALCGYLKHKKEIYRRTAAAALGKIKDPASVPHLIQALSDPFITVRLAAEQSLININEPAIPYLENAYQKTNNQVLRFHLQRIFSKIK